MKKLAFASVVAAVALALAVSMSFAAMSQHDEFSEVAPQNSCKEVFIKKPVGAPCTGSDCKRR